MSSSSTASTGRHPIAPLLPSGTGFAAAHDSGSTEREMIMKKDHNNPDQFVDEMVERYSSWPTPIRSRRHDDRRVLVRADSPAPAGWES